MSKHGIFTGLKIPNSAVLQPGSSVGPNAVLGNRAVAPEAESLQNGIWWGNPLLLLKRTDNETSTALGEVNHSAAEATVLPVLGAILVNAVMVFPFVAMLPVMLCVTTTPSDTYRNGIPTRNGSDDIYCWLLLWLVPWLAIVWWVAAALLWKMAFVGSNLSNLERGTAAPSNPSREAVIALNQTVMFAFDTVCEPLKGTPLYNVVLRLSGMRVGRNVCWLGEVCTEPDMLSIGDGTVVAPGVGFIAHNREAISYVFEVSGTLAKTWAKDSIVEQQRSTPNCPAHVQCVLLPMAAHRHWQWLRARRAVYPHGPHHNEEGVGSGANGTRSEGNDI